SCLLLLLALFIVFHDFGVNDVVIGGFGLGRGLWRFLLRGLVDRLAELALALAELLGRRLHRVVVVSRERGLELVKVTLHLGLHVFGQLVLVLRDELLHRVRELLGVVAQFGSFAALLVFF